ncbi:EmrB/QacA subfamily drug resistance transporter [Nocardia tenerifensis]|uniref:EmrB/QacA subfamily drug resistance transporter n=1 Tax=Nocardia tenerifensis TaxID=228006 RepID=A0A318K8X1_9NOCA|nr:DHA2 family efflux MFS transporter permease subunit [Nocardia tenerifensis]PXX66426.1 EmrB/QacA subfamily drug resistance transporter [Nocardia tenerifensis]
MQMDSTRRWLALGALAVAMLTIGLDVTVLTVALPTLAVDLNANTAALQWFSSAYTLALAAVMLPAGALGDRYGRKKLLLAALLVFGGASLACALAASAGQLIVARVVLGVAAAAMIPLSMAVLPSLFPEPEARQRALTIWITSTAIGLPLGPIVGGWLLRNFWWGSVFLINVPMVVIGALAVFTLVPESRSEQRFRFDVPGVLLSVLGMLGLTYGFIRLGEHGWGNGMGWVAVVAGALVLGAFALWQRVTAHPLIDPSVFAIAGFRWGTALSIVVNFAMFGMFFTVPQYFQAVLGVDALGSGLRLLPLIGGLIVGSRVVDKALPKLGTRAMLTLGFGLLAGALALGAMTDVHSGYGFTALWTTLLGAGMGLAMPTAMGLAMGELTAERSGSGSALIQALRQAGGTIGVAVLGTVLSTRYRSELGPLNHEPISDGVNAGVAVARRLGDSTILHQVQTAFVGGMSAMLWACAILCAVSAAVAAVFIRSRQPVEVTTGDPAAASDVAGGAVRSADASESSHVG